MNQLINDKNAATVVPKEARNWGMLCHLAGLSGYFLPPLGFVLGPLIVWAIKKDDHHFIDDQGKEAINFQLTIMICFLVSAVLVMLVIGIFMLIALGIFTFIMIIIASIKANEGVYYRYPMTIRFFK